MSRTSILLVVIALGLLGFIVFVERGSLSTTERELRKGRVLDNFVRERVTRVELQRHGVTTVLVRVAPNPDDPLDLGGWQVEAPYKAKADSVEVDSLLGALEWAEARRSIGAASPEDIKRFGLDAPRYRVRFLAGREEGGFVIGAPAADGSGAYLKPRGSDAVYVVGPDLLEALAHDPKDFHIKALNEGLTVLTAERLSLRRAGAPERLVVKRDGFFWLESPFAGLASRPEVRDIVDALDSLRASRYIGDEALPQYGLASPALSVTLDSLVYDSAHKGERKTERFSLSVGGGCAEHAEESYIQVAGGTVYCAPTAELDKLDVGAESLREQRLLPLDDDEIAKVLLRDGARELRLETGPDQTPAKTEGSQAASDVARYQLMQSGTTLQSGIADPDALKQWYSALREVKIESFSAATPAQRETIERAPMSARFERASADEAPYVMHVDASRSQATRLDQPSLLQLPARAIELLSPVAARFRAKRVLTEDESQLSSFTILQPGAAPERVERSSSGWAVVAPVEAEAARSTLSELARLFSGLEAVRFVADSTRPEHGLAPAYRTLRVVYAPDASDRAKDRVHTLIIGAKSGELGRYARLDDDPAVFVVSNALVAKLDEPLISHALPGFAAEGVRRVVVESGAKRAVVEPAGADGRGYRLAGAPDDSAALADQIVQRLARLRAERARGYGVPAPAGKPRLQVSVQLSGSEAPELSYRFYDDESAGEAGRVLLRRSDLPVTWVVDDAVVEPLEAALSIGTAKR